MISQEQKQKWNDATREILRKLDLPAEYRSLGLDICSKQPSAKGWWECRSFGREDRTPSAGINTVDGPFLGRYKDFKTGDNYGFFDFATKVAGKFGGDWKEARRHYANVTGVELPSGEDDGSVYDRYEFRGPPPSAIRMIYASGKPGVKQEAIVDAGGQSAWYPKNLSPEKTNNLIAFPMYGHLLDEVDPVGWHSVCENPRLQIRLFQGKGNQEKRQKVISSGDAGFMNADGVKRLKDADVVNLCEGISDVLACQSVLREWRELDPDGRKHVAIGMPGAGWTPKEHVKEHIQNFAGKEVRIWFDVGDLNKTGDAGALKWVRLLLTVTDKVRNIKLPIGPEGGKNDLRNWLAEGHTYLDMLDYATSFPYEVPGSPEIENATPARVLLDTLGIVVLGEHEGTQIVEIYSQVRRKSATIKDVNRLTVPTLCQIIGQEHTDKYVYVGRDDCPPDQFDLQSIKMAIAEEASKQTYYGHERLGAGVWDNDGELLLVKAGEIGVVKDGKINPSSIPNHKGKHIDCGRGSEDWYQAEVLSGFMEQAHDPQWCMNVITEAAGVFGQWQWRQAKQAPLTVTGLCIASWMQTTWDWRPQIFVTGNSSTGKTMLLQEVLAHGIFRKMGLMMEKPTEAAICQAMRHHGKVLFIDEFEKDSHRQNIMNLFRAASRGEGANKHRGTADHRGIKFVLKHIPWMGAIETGLNREADKNRYIILDLDRITPEKQQSFNPPSREDLVILGQKLLAIGLYHHDEIKALYGTLSRVKIIDVPPRCIESIALPVACVAAPCGYTGEQAQILLEEIAAGWSFKTQVEADHVAFMRTLLTSKIWLRGGVESTVTGLLSQLRNKAHDIDAAAALANNGIRLIHKRKCDNRFLKQDNRVLWIDPMSVGRNLLKGTPYEGQNVREYALRFPGSKVDQQYAGNGDVRVTGVSIPKKALDDTFDETGIGEDDEVEDTYSEAGELV